MSIDKALNTHLTQSWSFLINSNLDTAVVNTLYRLYHRLNTKQNSEHICDAFHSIGSTRL